MRCSYTQPGDILNLWTGWCRESNLGRWVDSELKFALLSIVHTQSLKEKRSKARSGTSTEGVEDEESLESSALISQLSDCVETEIYDLFSHSVVSTSVVVGSVLLAGYQLLRVKELPVGSSSHFIYDSWLQIQKYSSRNVFSGSSFTEESVEGIIAASDSLVRGHLAIRLDTVLETVQFPAGITDLTSGLSKVDRDTLTLKIR